MILHDRVTVVKSGGTDPRTGDPLPSTDVGPLPAAVQSLSTDEKALLGASVTTSALCVLGPVLPTELAAGGITSADKVEHAGITWDVDGDVEIHRVGGRVHHLELTLVRHQG